MLHWEVPPLVILAGVIFDISEGSSFKENLRFSCIKMEKYVARSPGEKTPCVASSFPNPKGKQRRITPPNPNHN